MRHLKSCKSGDTIMDSRGGKCRVYGRIGDVIVHSQFDRYDAASSRLMTWMEAEENNWKLLTKDGKEPMTKKEIEHLMNIKITP